MKRILITGKGSYIGTSVEKWLLQYPDTYLVDTLDMMGSNWMQTAFAGYDTVFHVAGIAHADVGNVSEERRQLYYQVNRDLAVKTARKAKAEGVKLFIYMSSIIVYGNGKGIHKKRNILESTEPSPDNFYGDSKLQAERELEKLDDEKFHIGILRPPMIYGKGSKGNYQILSRLACRTPIFPYIRNERSMLYIENFCEFVRLVIEQGESGLWFPQNAEYVRTSEMVQYIAMVHGKTIWVTSMFNGIIYILAHIPGKIGGLVYKAFGSLTYDKTLSEQSKIAVSSYQMKNLYESIKQTEE